MRARSERRSGTRNRSSRSRSRSGRWNSASRVYRSSNIQSPRRSARLAGLSATERQLWNAAQSLAQPEVHANRSSEQEPQLLSEGPRVPLDDTRLSERTRIDNRSAESIGEDMVEPARSLEIVRNNIDSGNRPYVMDIIVQPPSEIRPGELLRPPIVVRLEAQNQIGAVDNADVEIGNLWASAGIVSEDGLVALAPPQPNLLTGTLVDSLHPRPSQEAGQELGYFRFPKLAIHQTGNFRIQFLLARMPTDGSLEVVNIQSSLTSVIHVDDNAAMMTDGS